MAIFLRQKKSMKNLLKSWIMLPRNIWKTWSRFLNNVSSLKKNASVFSEKCCWKFRNIWIYLLLEGKCVKLKLFHTNVLVWKKQNENYMCVTLLNLSSHPSGPASSLYNHKDAHKQCLQAAALPADYSSASDNWRHFISELKRTHLAVMVIFYKSCEFHE